MTVAPVRIEGMAAGGDALGRFTEGERAGKVVFVTGALPNETVMADIVAEKKDFAKAVVVDVLDPSPTRVAPPCPALAAGCGGCGWQHIEPAAQLAMKAEVVRDALRRTARLPGAPVVVGSSVAPWSYRTSMRAMAGRDGRLGLRSARSHLTVPLDACMVAHPNLSALLATLRLSGPGEVSLRVSAATGERSAWSMEAGVRVAQAPSDVCQGAGASVTERVAGHDVRVSAESFFQSGPAAAELLVDAVRRAVGGAVDGRLVDAYGGVGMFAVSVPSTHVTVVEMNESACSDAAYNLDGSGDVVCSSIEEWLPTPADVVVADPSRRGLGAAAAERLSQCAAPTIVLVSCDPVALARDAGLLAGLGYRLHAAEVIDLFPNTHHVEVVSTFRR
jgi:23S rRNA (uracil1939-C5)-methyltransferase